MLDNILTSLRGRPLTLEGGSLSGDISANSDFTDIDVNSIDVGYDSLKIDTKQSNGDELRVDDSRNFALNVGFGLNLGLDDKISLKQDLILTTSLEQLDISGKQGEKSGTFSLQALSLNTAVSANSDFTDIDVNNFYVGYDSLKIGAKQSNGDELTVDSHNFALNVGLGLNRGSDFTDIDVNSIDVGYDSLKIAAPRKLKERHLASMEILSSRPRFSPNPALRAKLRESTVSLPPSLFFAAIFRLS